MEKLQKFGAMFIVVIALCALLTLAGVAIFEMQFRLHALLGVWGNVISFSIVIATVLGVMYAFDKDS